MNYRWIDEKLMNYLIRTQLKQLLIVLEHVPKETTPFQRLVIYRVVLMAVFMVDHIDEMASDFPEDSATTFSTGRS